MNNQDPVDYSSIMISDITKGPFSIAVIFFLNGFRGSARDNRDIIPRGQKIPNGLHIHFQVKGDLLISSDAGTFPTFKVASFYCTWEHVRIFNTLQMCSSDLESKERGCVKFIHLLSVLYAPKSLKVVKSRLLHLSARTNISFWLMHLLQGLIRRWDSMITVITIYKKKEWETII